MNRIIDGRCILRRSDVISDVTDSVYPPTAAIRDIVAGTASLFSRQYDVIGEPPTSVKLDRQEFVKSESAGMRRRRRQRRAGAGSRCHVDEDTLCLEEIARNGYVEPKTIEYPWNAPRYVTAERLADIIKCMSVINVFPAIFVRRRFIPLHVDAGFQ